MTNDNKHSKQTDDCFCGRLSCQICASRSMQAQTAGGMIARMEPNQDFSDMWHVSNGSYVRYPDHLAIVERLESALELITRECNAMNKGPVAVMIALKALAQPANNLGHQLIGKGEG